MKSRSPQSYSNSQADAPAGTWALRLIWTKMINFPPPLPQHCTCWTRYKASGFAWWLFDWLSCSVPWGSLGWWAKIFSSSSFSGYWISSRPSLWAWPCIRSWFLCRSSVPLFPLRPCWPEYPQSLPWYLKFVRWESPSPSWLPPLATPAYWECCCKFGIFGVQWFLRGGCNSRWWLPRSARTPIQSGSGTIGFSGFSFPVGLWSGWGGSEIGKCPPSALFSGPIYSTFRACSKKRSFAWESDST